MSDRYSAHPIGGGKYDVTECDENGVPVRIIGTVNAGYQDLFEGLHDIVAELNRLERLVEDSVNMAHLTDRTKVHHAFQKQDMTKALVMSLHEEHEDQQFTKSIHRLHANQWNRIVRTLKELAEKFLLP